MCDGYSVTTAKIDLDKAIVTGVLFNYDSQNKKEKLLLKEISVLFVNQNHKWKILEIKY